jgi:hypothetical protein
MSEKRQHIRTAFSAQVKIIHPQVGELIVEMRDISNGGVYLLTGELANLEVGQELQLQAQDIEDAPVLTARVVRVEPKGIALMFCEY